MVNQKYYNIVNDKRLDKPLCAYLIDEETKTAIPDANVSISGTDISVVSNDKGYFEIPAVAPNRIVISHINYQSVQISPEAIL